LNVAASVVHVFCVVSLYTLISMVHEPPETAPHWHPVQPRVSIASP
jgi:hypothetical protein